MATLRYFHNATTPPRRAAPPRPASPTRLRFDFDIDERRLHFREQVTATTGNPLPPSSTRSPAFPLSTCRSMRANMRESIKRSKVDATLSQACWQLKLAVCLFFVSHTLQTFQVTRTGYTQRGQMCVADRKYILTLKSGTDSQLQSIWALVLFSVCMNTHNSVNPKARELKLCTSCALYNTHVKYITNILYSSQRSGKSTFKILQTICK